MRASAHRGASPLARPHHCSPCQHRTRPTDDVHIYEGGFDDDEGRERTCQLGERNEIEKGRRERQPERTALAQHHLGGGSFAQVLHGNGRRIRTHAHAQAHTQAGKVRIVFGQVRESQRKRKTRVNAEGCLGPTYGTGACERGRQEQRGVERTGRGVERVRKAWNQLPSGWGSGEEVGGGKKWK